jgi:hypothetical protein
MICGSTSSQICCDDQIKKSETGGACSMHGRAAKLNKIPVIKAAEYLRGVYGSMVLKLILIFEVRILLRVCNLI